MMQKGLREVDVLIRLSGLYADFRFARDGVVEKDDVCCEFVFERVCRIVDVDGVTCGLVSGIRKTLARETRIGEWGRIVSYIEVVNRAYVLSSCAGPCGFPIDSACSLTGCGCDASVVDRVRSKINWLFRSEIKRAANRCRQR
jgi:hypothetical protein